MPRGIYDRSTAKKRPQESIDKATATIRSRWSERPESPLKGKPKSPEHRAKLAEANRRKAQDPEFLAKLSASHERSPRISCVRCRRSFKERAFKSHVRVCTRDCTICGRPNFGKGLCKHHYFLYRKTTAMGWDFETAVERWTRSDGRCEICNTELLEFGHAGAIWKIACTDHCHATDEFRGFLCQSCNTLLGCAKDDVDVLKAAIKYLETSRTTSATVNKGEMK